LTRYRATHPPMARKAHFTPALFAFLSELRDHNDRDWFERNRERYLRDARDPMLRFISDFGPVLGKIAPCLVADPRPVGGSLFRVHRDARFSRDKTPYKTNVAAHFRHQAGRDVHGPGYYLSLEPDEVEVGGGIWHPESEALRRIRASMLEDPAPWKRATGTPAMKRLTWWGESLVRAPRGSPEDHPLLDLLKRKDLAAGATLRQSDACSPGFLDRCAEIYRSLAPTMKLLAGAVELPW
jgi:uncharacterized protein (TIGR02453 family)